MRRACSLPVWLAAAAVLASCAGPDAPRARAAAARAPGPAAGAYHLLALGDSIVWGQGLREEEKFRTLAARRVEEALGVRVRQHVYAHSGAIVAYTDRDRPADDDPIYADWPGEVNRAFPTVTQQLERFLRDRPCAPEDVRLVLVDGGINDVDVRTMLAPRDMRSAIERRVEAHCYGAMKALIERIAASCPEAAVIVTGYYAAVSPLSSIFGPGILAEGERAEFEAYLREIGVDVAPAPAPAAPAAGGPAPRAFDPLAAIAVNWAVFHERATAALARAACEADPRGGRVRFVDPGFDAVHAAHAPAALLFPFKLRGPLDPVARERAAACRRAFAPGVRRAICEHGSAGHPNARGARRYFEAVAPVIDEILDARRAPSRAGR